MPKYEVLVSRNIDQWATITIEADSPGEARDIATDCGNDGELPDGTEITFDQDIFDTEVTIQKIDGEEVDESMLEEEEED